MNEVYYNLANLYQDQAKVSPAIESLKKYRKTLSDQDRIDEVDKRIKVLKETLILRKKELKD